MTTLVYDQGPLITLRPASFPSKDVRWGQPWQVGTAAYWVGLTARLDRRCRRNALRIGETLAEEIVACLLGGHGIPHETGLAAFRRLRDDGLLDGAPPTSIIEEALRSPLRVDGRTVRYRYPRQKARFVAAALEALRRERPPSSPPDLREWLLRLPGVGLKTSAWIVRNHFGSEEVAIIDVHIRRSGVQAGVFEPYWSPASDYGQMEELFLCWAKAGDVGAAELDSVIWSERAHAPRAYAQPSHLE